MARMVPRQRLVWLALLIGVLVAAWHPVMAMPRAAAVPMWPPAEQTGSPVSIPAAVAGGRATASAAPTPLPTLDGSGSRGPQLQERIPLERRHPSWHRGVSRRLPRGMSGQLSLPSESGSIPAPFRLYSQRLEWHVLPLPLVHGVGGRSAPPRAPPR